MAKRKLRCFLVMYRGKYYRPFGSIVSIHAVSIKSACRMLSNSTPGLGFRVFKGLYLIENPNCDPSHITAGDHCYYHLVAKPRYDKTPLGSMAPNSPEWERRVLGRRPDPKERRQELIDHVQKRKDAYGQ